MTGRGAQGEPPDPGEPLPPTPARERAGGPAGGVVPPPPPPPSLAPVTDLPAGAILALDLGLQRTGLARSDPDRQVAFGLPTFEVRPGRSLKVHLTALARDVPLAGVVIGLPMHMDGRPGGLAPRALRLAAWIRETLRLPVSLRDERLTTFEAEEMLKESDRRVRRDRGVRDRLAAQILLREFLAEGCPFLQGDWPDSPEEAAR